MSKTLEVYQTWIIYDQDSGVGRRFEYRSEKSAVYVIEWFNHKEVAVDSWPVLSGYSTPEFAQDVRLWLT